MVSQTIGSRRQVWNGTAKKTPGGLHKSDLIMNKHRRIVSRKKSVSSSQTRFLKKEHNRAQKMAISSSFTFCVHNTIWYVQKHITQYAFSTNID